MSMVILLVVGNGGFTHAAPVLEIGRILSQRGHRIEFATHQGQEKWVQDDPSYAFIERVYTMGPAMTPEVADEYYLQAQQSDIRTDPDGWLRPMHTVAAFWTSDYAHLKDVVLPASKPDMIVADFFVEAAKDMQHQTGIPLAVVWPVMPYMMLDVPYVPGLPGFQTDALTSEHASLWTRVRAEFRPLRSLPAVVRFLRFVRSMRRASGVYYMPPLKNKPNHLILINSFWGVETPKDLPPLVATIGPILAENYHPLDDALTNFYTTYRKVLYIALGTHIRVLPPDLTKFITAITVALREGLIDGVVWAANKTQMSLFQREEEVIGEKHTVGDLLDGKHDAWFFTPFAPQRAILAHPNTVLYITHGGGSSVNEALYHGTAMIVIGFFFDQLLNGLSLREAGVALTLDKAGFSTEEVLDKMRRIRKDEDGSFGQNVTRMQHIARISSRKKEYGADLVEEVMYDHRFSLEPPGARAAESKKRRRPMHLQTADARMSAWRAQNWDLRVLGLVSVSSVVALAFGIKRSWPLVVEHGRFLSDHCRTVLNW